tara:strand:- start:907 stop:1788 length:882 start_codon:yes stop_codon:yes gene_type:complete
MVATLVLNSSNIIDNGNNNTLVYSFPSSVQFPNHEIAVQQISMYYAWENINPAPLANNTFTYRWTSGVTTTTYSVVIPRGLYEIIDINNYLQFVFIKNGTYLIDAGGQNVYYAEFLVNPNRYAIQINTFPVPTTLPTGFTVPVADPASGSAGFVGFPTATFNPALSIGSNLNKILGFTTPIPFTTPLNSGVGTNLSFLSNVAPQVQPNSSVYVSISNISNKYSSPTSVIYSITPNVNFGEQIRDTPPQFAWNKLLHGTYNEIRVTFLGIDFQPLTILDPNMTIVLVIKDTKDI